jgi:rubredoxin
MSHQLDRLRSSVRPRREYHCVACGYGAIRRSPPDRCPLCGGVNWREAGWKPFAELPKATSAPKTREDGPPTGQFVMALDPPTTTHGFEKEVCQ